MRKLVLLTLVALTSSAWSASGTRRGRAAGDEGSRKTAGNKVAIDVDADDLKGQLADLFEGKSTDWDLFVARARILEEKKPEAFVQLADNAAEIFADRFGGFEKSPEVLRPNDRHVLSNLWLAFPGFLDSKLYRRLADRPTQEEMARLLEAYEAALTDTKLTKQFPIFDSHFHYYRDNPDRNLLRTPEAVIALLRRFNVVGTLASGIPNDGIETLHRLAPDLIAPEVMPNKSLAAHDHANADNYSWHQNPGVVSMVKRWLRSELPLVGIGEIHISDVDKGLTSAGFNELVKLSNERYVLHLHMDVKDIQAAIDHVFEVNKQARVVLAHGGFRGIGAPTQPPAKAIADLLKKYPNLYIDMSAREDLWRDGRLDEAWRKLLLKHHDRVMLGTDPYLRYRWEFYGALLYRMRQWLATLPNDVAADVSHRNGLRLFRPALTSATARGL